MAWPPTLTLPSVMESGVVGVWGAAAGVEAAAVFSSGLSCLSCAKLLDEAVNAAAMVSKQTKGIGRLGRARSMDSTSGGLDESEYSVMPCWFRLLVIGLFEM